MFVWDADKDASGESSEYVDGPASALLYCGKYEAVPDGPACE